MPRAGGSRTAGIFRTGLPWVILAAAVFWAVALPHAESSVFGRVPLLDEVYYLDRARDPAGEQGHYVSPLYPRLIAWTGSGLSPDARLAEGGDLRGVRLLQIACWFGTVVLLRLIAGRLYEDRVEGRLRSVAVWLPAALFALYLPAAAYALAILLELPQVFLTTMAVWLALRLKERPAVLTAAILGLVLGLAGLLRGTTLILLPVGLAAAWAADPRRWRLPLVALACAVLVLAPDSLRNMRAAGRLAGPTLNGGVNLAIGNNPEANGFYVALVPGDWRADPAGIAFLAGRERRPELTLAQADAVWRDQALAWMQEHPVRAAALWAKKVWLHLQGWEIDQLTPLRGWAGSAPALRILVVPYGLIAAMGITGFWAGRGDRRLLFLLAALAALLFAQSLFFVVSRYRLILVVFLALAAGGAVSPLMRRRRSAWVVATAAVLAVLPWGLGEIRATFARQAAANEALRHAAVGAATADPAASNRAFELFRIAVAEGPSSPAAWLGLASMHNGRGEWAESEKVLLRGWEHWPREVEIGKQIVALRLRQGRGEEALEAVEAVLAVDPREADTLHNAVILLSDMGRVDEAAVMARRLIAAHPADPRGFNDLGILLARSGDVAAAREAFTRGLAAVPGHPGLTANLARLEKNSD